MNMFCGDYTRSTTLPSNITCTVYFGDSNEYMDVLTVKSFQASAGDTFFTAIGDACDSFCGNVKKFLFFSNTTSYQSPISSQPTCDLILGTVNPICLTTYEGVTTFCGVGEYTKNQNSCASKLKTVKYPLISFCFRLSVEMSRLLCTKFLLRVRRYVFCAW